MRWSYNNNNVDKELEFVIVKTISGFLNSKGGILLIGIKDDGSILGLENDYKTLNKKNRDGFLLKLSELVCNYIGKEFLGFIDAKIIQSELKDICFVKVECSDKPTFINNEMFFIRGINGLQKLDSKQMVNYISSHWKSQHFLGNSYEATIGNN